MNGGTGKMKSLHTKVPFCTADDDDHHHLTHSVQSSPIQSNLPYSHREHRDCTIPPQHDHLHTQADLTRQSQAVVCPSLSASWHQQQKCQSVTGTPSLSPSAHHHRQTTKTNYSSTLRAQYHKTTIQVKSNKNIINNKAKQSISK